MEIRLQKYLANAGIASRRKSEVYIQEEKVSVNGKIITSLGTKINPDIDRICFEGKPVNEKEKRIYVILNKPEGYVTTAKDQFNRPTVIDLLKSIDERVFPVGRLDYHTEGLLILTNDGDLTYKITHPKHHINKTYLAKVKGNPLEEELDQLRKGIKIENYHTSPAEIKMIGMEKKKYSILQITIHEGKNRQVRKMCAAIGYPVLHLKRVSIGNLHLGDLETGQYRFLTVQELDYLKSL